MMCRRYVGARRFSLIGGVSAIADRQDQVVAGVDHSPAAFDHLGFARVDTCAAGEYRLRLSRRVPLDVTFPLSILFTLS